MHNHVGLEGIWSNLSQKTESLTSTLSSLVDRGYEVVRVKQVRDTLKSLFTRVPVTGATPGIDPVVLKWFQKVDFMSISPVTVYVPRGMVCSYQEYIGKLTALVQLASTMNTELLLPINAMISTLINNPSFLRSASPLPLKAALMGKQPEDLIKSLTECFDKTNVSDQLPFGKAYKSLGNYQQVKSDAGALQAIASSPALLDVEKIALLIVDNVEVITRNMKEDETFPSISNAVKRQLVECLDHAARWVELYAVLQYQVMTLNAALVDTDKKIKSLAKR